MSKFSERLREVRANSRMKQREVAEYLGVKLQTYQGYEMSRSEPSIQKLVALADYFDVSLDYLMGRTQVCTGRGGYGTPCKYAAFCQKATQSDCKSDTEE